MSQLFSKQLGNRKKRQNKKHFPLIVITGGPGAGKTAFIESLRRSCRSDIALLPEAASILFGGGFWRMPSATGKRAAQRAIFHVQTEMETLVRQEGQWILGVCDRGTLDGLAYWNSNRSDFFKAIQSSLHEEYTKYKAVIHLRTPSNEMGYNHSNPVRIESAGDAKLIDSKIEKIWKSHPSYFSIESTTDFLEKISRARGIFDQLLLDFYRNH